MQEEIWKDIKGYEGLYQVSNLGNVRSLKYRKSNKTRILSLRYNPTGYVQVCLSKNGIYKYPTVHRLVANAFLPNINNKEQVNHIDGNKHNNCLSNLEWCTSIENMKHAVRTGLLCQKGKCFKREVNQYSVNNIFIKRWHSINEASSECDIARSCILYCCQKIYKTAGGFIWKYAD